MQKNIWNRLTLNKIAGITSKDKEDNKSPI